MTFEEMCELAKSRKQEMLPGKSTTDLFAKGAHGIGKKLVEEAPKPILEGANKADSDAAKKKLEEAGAKVEVK